MACCGKTDSDPNNVNTSGFTNQGDRKGAHFNIQSVVKMQSLIRGFLARRRVQRLRESSGRRMMHYGNYNGQANYENQDVQVILSPYYKTEWYRI